VAISAPRVVHQALGRALPVVRLPVVMLPVMVLLVVMLLVVMLPVVVLPVARQMVGKLAALTSRQTTYTDRWPEATVLAAGSLATGWRLSTSSSPIRGRGPRMATLVRRTADSQERRSVIRRSGQTRRS
jgi:hypothetical protein